MNAMRHLVLGAWGLIESSLHGRLGALAGHPHPRFPLLLLLPPRAELGSSQMSSTPRFTDEGQDPGVGGSDQREVMGR